jgi:adenine-specific DNA-methyltransferase
MPSPIQFKTPNFAAFPTTRFHGSKRRLLGFLYEKLVPLQITTALDLFSGSATVLLLLRSMNINVDANDYLAYNKNIAALFLRLMHSALPTLDAARADLTALLNGRLTREPLVSQNFGDVFFTDWENMQIDRFCQNVGGLCHADLYVYAVGQALLKKRPFGLFHRCNLNLRRNVVTRSFGNKTTWETTILDHALQTIAELRRCEWPNQPGGAAFGVNTACGLTTLPDRYDLIYVDPPYVSSRSGKATNYADLYHFLNGLIEYDLYDSPDLRHKHRPVFRGTGAWAKPDAALTELNSYFTKWPSSIIAISYRYDGAPTLPAMIEVAAQHGRRCELHTTTFQYALSPSASMETLLIAYRS